MLKSLLRIVENTFCGEQQNDQRNHSFESMPTIGELKEFNGKQDKTRQMEDKT